MSRCVGRCLVCEVVLVCLCGVCGAVLIELYINKFCGLSDERFLRFKLGSVMMCW